MNWKQILCMWLGVAAFVFFALTTETTRASMEAVWVDYGPLVARSLSTIVVTLALVYTFRKKNHKDG